MCRNCGELKNLPPDSTICGISEGFPVRFWMRLSFFLGRLTERCPFGLQDVISGGGRLADLLQSNFPEICFDAANLDGLDRPVVLSHPRIGGRRGDAREATDGHAGS